MEGLEERKMWNRKGRLKGEKGVYGGSEMREESDGRVGKYMWENWSSKKIRKKTDKQTDRQRR